jgi:hypothetical protein
MTGGFAAFLLAIAGPLARKVMFSLGIGVVAFVGLDLAVSGMLDAARAAWAGMAGDIAAYLAIAGVHKAMAIIGGAITARIAMVAMKRIAVL